MSGRWGQGWIGWVILGVLLLGPDLPAPAAKAAVANWSSSSGPQDRANPGSWLAFLPPRNERFRLGPPPPPLPRPRPRRRLFLLYRRLQLEGC